MKKLVWLKLDDVNTTYENLSLLKKLCELRHLSISTNFTPAVAKAVSEIKSLRSLAIEGGKTSEPTFHFLKKLKNLNRLALNDFDNSLGLLPKVKSLPKLRYLYISEIEYSTDSLRELSELDHIWLGGDEIKREYGDFHKVNSVLNPLLPFSRSINYLRLDCSDTKRDFSLLKSYTNLKALFLENCQTLSTKELNILLSLPQLRHLVLDGKKANLRGASHKSDK